MPLSIDCSSIALFRVFGMEFSLSTFRRQLSREFYRAVSSFSGYEALWRLYASSGF